MSDAVVDDAGDHSESASDDRSHGESNLSQAHEESESDDEDLNELDRYWPPPVGESVRLVGSAQGKTMSAFKINNAGTRFASGGHDHSLKIWDFKAIDRHQPESICTAQPCGQTVITQLDYSHDDELILVVSGSCQALLVAKDGIFNKQHECPKGDQYISDMANTKGHVQMLNDGRWNPREKSTFITCSNDSTIRIWDVNKTILQKAVIKARSPVSGLKSVPNTCNYSPDALLVVAGCNDGSVLMWDTRRKFISTSSCIRNAHLKGSELSCVVYSYGQTKICTRSEDESCKIWDTRQLKQPLGVRSGLATLYSSSNCSFSPDDKYILTGTSHTRSVNGELLFLDLNKDNLPTAHSIEVPDASVIRVEWQPKINHIGYSCSNGLLNVLYDDKRSLGGLLAMRDADGNPTGTKRKRYVSQAVESQAVKRIITPHSLPLFRDDPSAKSFAKIRQDPRRSYKPEIPVSDSRIKPAGSTLSSYIARNIAKPADDNGLDIRERILRHAGEAERDPIWIKPQSSISSSTQPTVATSKAPTTSASATATTTTTTKSPDSSAPS